MAMQNGILLIIRIQLYRVECTKQICMKKVFLIALTFILVSPSTEICAQTNNELYNKILNNKNFIEYVHTLKSESNLIRTNELIQNGVSTNKYVDMDFDKLESYSLSDEEKVFLNYIIAQKNSFINLVNEVEEMKSFTSSQFSELINSVTSSDIKNISVAYYNGPCENELDNSYNDCFKDYLITTGGCWLVCLAPVLTKDCIGCHFVAIGLFRSCDTKADKAYKKCLGDKKSTLGL
jgi:hypothetical protein